MSEPICFRCKHFRQDQPLNFLKPGQCRWSPSEAVPEWLRSWLDYDEDYYGPKRDVWSRGHIIEECPAFAVSPAKEGSP